MKATWIVLLTLIGLLLCSGLASAELLVKPGTQLPLVLNNFKVTTDTPVLPDWKPSHIRWNLINPEGKIVSFVDSDIDSIGQDSGGIPIIGSTTWMISENSGYITVPAFAEKGTWCINAVLSDRFLLVFVNEAGSNIYFVQVEEGGTTDNLQAPVVYILSLPVLGSYCLSMNIIYIVLIVVAVIFLILVLISIKGRRT